MQILCETEGGLGNRLGSLVNALWLKEELKIDSIKLKWSKTYECGADWFELFNPIEGVTTVCDFNDSLKLAHKTWIAISKEFTWSAVHTRAYRSSRAYNLVPGKRRISSIKESMLHQISKRTVKYRSH